MKISAAAFRRLLLGIAVLAAVVVGVTLVGAQTPPPSPTPPGPNVAREGLDFVTGKTFLLTMSLLIFGTIIIFLEYLLIKDRLADKIDDLAKFFIITLIIIGTLVLVGAGFEAQQIAPVIGLFGTVAGYLLGRNSQHSPTADDGNGAADGGNQPANPANPVNPQPPH